MPDITMCDGQGCELKSTCYRYKAEPSMYQTYFTEAPIEDEQCDYYWEVKKNKMLNTIINDIDIVLEAIQNNDLQDAINMLTEIQQDFNNK
jgi:hypothetical protein